MSVQHITFGRIKIHNFKNCMRTHNAHRKKNNNETSFSRESKQIIQVSNYRERKKKRQRKKEKNAVQAFFIIKLKALEQ